MIPFHMETSSTDASFETVKVRLGFSDVSDHFLYLPLTNSVMIMHDSCFNVLLYCLLFFSVLF